MTKRLLIITLILLALGIFSTVVLAAPGNTTPNVTITVLNLPPDGILELGVGESYTFDILVVSDQPFKSAMALPAAYFPGRGIFFHGSDHASQNTTALLHLTVTGKGSTAELPNGANPASINVGVRFGGLTVGQTFDFGVAVP
ncbi:MAG TPA: hypothetical protein VHO69_19380 [Phototrophicaceae bacterium]|nr:hypothetical protein [Phototrophicaceae bacterium]